MDNDKVTKCLDIIYFIAEIALIILLMAVGLKYWDKNAIVASTLFSISVILEKKY